MARRIAVAAVWVWGFWALGSALEFLRIAPSWPALALGFIGALAASGLLRLPRPAHMAHRPRPEGAAARASDGAV